MSTATGFTAAVGAHVENGRPLKMPPHNFDAELGLIGSIMRDPSVLDDPRIAQVTPGDLFDRTRAIAFELTCEAAHSHPGMEADALTMLVDSALQVRAKLDPNDAMTLLDSCVEKAPTAADAFVYAGIVIDTAQRRATIEAAYQAAEEARRGVVPIGNVLNALRADVESIDAKGNPGPWLASRSSSGCPSPSRPACCPSRRSACRWSPCPSGAGTGTSPSDATCPSSTSRARPLWAWPASWAGTWPSGRSGTTRGPSRPTSGAPTSGLLAFRNRARPTRGCSP
jgi:hypothetical protein